MRRGCFAHASLFLFWILAQRMAVLAQPESPDELLWREIETSRHVSTASQPYEAWFDAQRAVGENLARKLRTYLTLYPGGRHRDEAAAIELQTLFEIDCLADGRLSALQQRAEEHMRSPLSPACEQEAAYWLMICRRRERAATTQPVAEPLMLLDANLVDEYSDYVTKYPTARRVPRLATILFDSAAARNDRAVQRELAHLLERYFPTHANTEYCRGALRRVEEIGRPFAERLSTIFDGMQDVKSISARPLLIVVWTPRDCAAVAPAASSSRAAGTTRPSANLLQEITAFAHAHPESRIIGVAIGDSAPQVIDAAAAAGIAWPQHFDERAWAGEFVRRWGVRTTPFVFVIDANGVLRSATDGPDWYATAAKFATP